MEPVKKIEERLWAYLDGVGSQQERQDVEHLLASDPQWRQAFERLSQFHLTLREGLELEFTSMRFQKNVMEQISALRVAPATKEYLSKKVIYGIGLFFLLLIASVLFIVLPGIHFSSGSSVFPENMTRAISVRPEWTKGVFLQSFLIIDAFLGLFLLDKYLQRKKNKNSHILMNKK
jgi:hypothetical protein